MRSEQEMLDLILSIARRDDRIRVVIMNGSRANPNAPAISSRTSTSSTWLPIPSPSSTTCPGSTSSASA